MVELRNTNSNQSAYFVRGGNDFDFHRDIFSDFVYKELSTDQDNSIQASCRGGGRVQFGEKGLVKVYGFSYAYGMADHEVAAEIIR